MWLKSDRLCQTYLNILTNSLMIKEKNLFEFPLKAFNTEDL